MAKNFIKGGRVVSVAAPRAVKSGDLVILGLLAGVAQTDAALGAAVEIDCEGVYDLAKTQAQAWVAGAAIYAVPATGLATTATTAGNVLIGVALAAAANPSPLGRVRLNGAAPAAST